MRSIRRYIIKAIPHVVTAACFNVCCLYDDEYLIYTITTSTYRDERIHNGRYYRHVRFKGGIETPVSTDCMYISYSSFYSPYRDIRQLVQLTLDAHLHVQY